MSLTLDFARRNRTLLENVGVVWLLSIFVLQLSKVLIAIESLITQPISKSSATQRAGRAGRLVR